MLHDNTTHLLRLTSFPFSCAEINWLTISETVSIINSALDAFWCTNENNKTQKTIGNSVWILDVDFRKVSELSKTLRCETNSRTQRHYKQNKRTPETVVQLLVRATWLNAVVFWPLSWKKKKIITSFLSFLYLSCDSSPC